MNTEKLKQLIEIKEYQTILNNISQIELKECSLNELKEILAFFKEEGLDNNYILLFRQFKQLTVYDRKYCEIIHRDFLLLLEAFLEQKITETNSYWNAKELQEANHLYQKAMKGDSVSQLLLGQIYKTIGHDDWAFVWYEQAAAAGNLDAIYWLGNFYYDGVVVREDWEKAYLAYKEAALKGHADAMNNYADMYLRGEFVEKDEQRAFELFSIAADRGVAEAMYTLGYMYENGVGVDLDKTKSHHWFTQSALAGDVFAANRLGHEAFQNGDGVEAMRWYQLAADQQDVDGEFNLGFCYEAGIGTQVNFKKAKYWYQKAALQGDQEAREKLKLL
ncbi:sel1 repeat family protein [Rummeliibacillus sp. G93]|uniref:tetratricopeptide repeat protein n=1 Tax=Rummeliibacillus TaxID=648802 RepID=UPI001166C0D7|nr:MULTISPECIES: tetratricopeptide repeat protein [Rummeliibacillus]MBB5169398.1 hypothetical protein [Rummeliibacillus stabekisii]UQW98854.1 sel1 repeat family protein [Rummeliibacillus sp. G93]GEL03658.1 hypothetical protein RST01_02850 [Rummeliibacillus stabekisii]